MYSLAGYAVGVYTLDIIADTGNERGAYETILVILAKDQQPIEPAQIINKVKQITDVQIIFEEPKECRKGYALVKGKCVLIPIVCKQGTSTRS